MALGLLILAFSTIPMDDAQTQIALLVGGISAGVYLVRQIITGKWSFKNFQDKNGWNYLAQLLILISPQFAELVPGLQSLVEALIDQDWGAVISAAVSLVTILYYILSSKTNKNELKRLMSSVPVIGS